MNDWIGLAVILLIVLGGLYLLVRANRPKALTQEEYEQRLRENVGRGMMSAGVVGLQKIFEPGVERAAAVLEDFRAGHYDGEQESGDGDDEEDRERNKG